jgi:hypothetical protein
MTERVEVQRLIPAPPDQIFDVVRDPRGQVTIDASGMLQGWTGERASGVGDAFTVHMDRESLGDFPLGKYDVTVTITNYEPNSYITWEISGAGFSSLGHYYGYKLEARDEGTLVTSIYDWSQVDDELKKNLSWPVVPELSLKATLGILERVVKQGA